MGKHGHNTELAPKAIPAATAAAPLPFSLIKLFSRLQPLCNEGLTAKNAVHKKPVKL